MRFDTKLTILAILPLLLVCWFGIELVEDELRKKAHWEKTEKNIHLVKKISRLLHQAKKERGLSIGFVVDANEKTKVRLVKQQAKTDEALANLTENHSATNLPIKKAIGNVRQDVLSQSIPPDSIKSFFEGFQNRMMKLLIRTTQGWATEIRQKVLAYRFLIESEDRLGIIRAIVFKGLKEGEMDKEAFTHFMMAYNHFGDALERYRMLSIDTQFRLANGFAGTNFQSGIKTVLLKQIKNTRSLPSDLTPEQWWSLATRRVDTLFKTGIHKLEALEKQARVTSNQVARNAWIKIGSAGLILLLTIWGSYRTIVSINKQMDAYDQEQKHHKQELQGIVDQLREKEVSLETKNRELQNYAGKLRESNANLEQFGYVISHDLQEPLRKIKAFNNRILQEQEKIEVSDKMRESIKRSLNATERLQHMIHDLLSYSRVTSHHNEFSTVNLENVIERTKADLEVLINETGAKIEYADLPQVQGDFEQLKRLFQNLITNSIKFRKEGEIPTVWITAPQTVEEIVNIDIRDNGIGFDPQYNQQIFDIFKRLEVQHYSGTGIGLAIAKKIVDQHSGAITVDSRPGEGTVFHIQIPCNRPLA